MIPADSRVEIDAKIAAGYFTNGNVMTMDELSNVQGRAWEDVDVSVNNFGHELSLTIFLALINHGYWGSLSHPVVSPGLESTQNYACMTEYSISSLADILHLHEKLSAVDFLLEKEYRTVPLRNTIWIRSCSQSFIAFSLSSPALWSR